MNQYIDPNITFFILFSKKTNEEGINGEIYAEKIGRKCYPFLGIKIRQVSITLQGENW